MLWPYNKFKAAEARVMIQAKVMAFMGKARIHPWMKLWAEHAGEKTELYQQVEHMCRCFNVVLFNVYFLLHVA